MKVGVEMDKVRIAIVDDSPFSIAVLREMLEANGFEVVGEAGSLEETIQTVKEVKPDLVTMDMTIPGTDGLECTRAIHQIDSSIKVIVVSSMMDDEIVQKARKNKVSGYIQKPADPDELALLINRIMASEELFKELSGYYYSVFKEGFLDTFNKFVKTVPEIKEENNSNIEQVSRGISIVVGIIGKYSGRIIFDLSHQTAENITEAMLKRKPKNLEEVLNVMGEFSNIMAGNACSVINRKNKLFGLRVAPPTIFHGESINISKAELDCTTSAITDSKFGEILINVGFVKEAGEWMSSI